MKIVFTVFAVIGVFCCAAWGNDHVKAADKYGKGSAEAKREVRLIGVTIALTIASIIGVALS